MENKKKEKHFGGVVWEGPPEHDFCFISIILLLF